jgi:hypothetical protein
MRGGSNNAGRLVRLPVVLLLQLGLLLASVQVTSGLDVSTTDDGLLCSRECSAEGAAPMGIRWDEV